MEVGFEMKKIRSKKGLTLVELVVTVAILAITSGMGVGIFVSALNNYSTSSALISQQQKAGMIENYIVTGARNCKNLYFIDSSTPTTATPTTSHIFNETAFNQLVSGMANKTGVSYITMEKDETNATYKSQDRDDAGNLNESNAIEIEGVESIVFSCKKQKIAPDVVDDPSQCFYYLNYDIKMVDGYSLSGSVILNNADDLRRKISTNVSTTLVEDADFGTVKVGDDAVKDKTGVVFLNDVID